MRRRKGNNRLLIRILMVSVLAHVVALPILAHYGAFKKIQQHFIETRLVTLPPPERERPRPEEHKTAQRQKPSRTAKRSNTTTPHQTRAAQRSNLSQPKVIASGAAAGAGGSDQGTVDANGTGKAGQLPTQQADTTPPTVRATAPTPAPEPKPQPAPQPQPVKVGEGPKPEPKPEPAVSPEPKHVPVFTDVTPIDSPQPTIPDDLRTEALDKTFVAEFDVSPDGTPADVKVAKSTGSDELDQLALDAAKKWRFKPATRDGQPIESRVRLHIEFQVS